jgi:hypothetical protein
LYVCALSPPPFINHRLIFCCQHNTHLRSFRTEFNAGMDYLNGPTGAAFANALRANTRWLAHFEGPGGTRVDGRTTIDVAQRNEAEKAAAREGISNEAVRQSAGVCALM